MEEKKELTCRRCKSTWTPRKKYDLPIYCPRCKSPLWNKAYVRDVKRPGDSRHQPGVPRVLSEELVEPKEVVTPTLEDMQSHPCFGESYSDKPTSICVHCSIRSQCALAMVKRE